ncbi:hypothetical protein SPRG_19994 [Saprolegnia parasitica CBS 223.65]|uniref:5'-Nucleotidase C-terminal domain-containing protein n=1 Tax=Saprolegnia parasitica (strain CBS 223.65) TaxID=695850 RepID=A0A067CDF6_SAPPC|nr:hypothetical protein SPRG_19994 [Saprolegnia parasitica CBS 223.65]KDO28784.1 hypothetical protein SPRG_19994 [Saprolegnia parasitica CBS 223.65]|eukprot:XP_012200524.1 hypothetical protein SPRG_19994 [Saprolegnia parasitica CBS 223.65]
MVATISKLLLLLGATATAVVGDCGTARAPTAHFQVLSYNDVYEMKNESDAAQYGVLVGGPSRVIPVAQKLRKNFANSLIIFAGDTMSPSLWSGQFKGLQMIEAHNAIGVDFACLGNHEFDFGIDAFLNVSAASKFPWLNINAYEVATKQLLRGTQKYATKEFNSATMGKIKIGAFGVMYDMQDATTGMYWTDPIAASKDAVKYLREVEKVDMVIALTHQFLDDDNRFSQQVKGIDMIYGGHDHTAMLQSNFGTPYLKSDLNFRSIWVSDIKYYGPLTEGKNKYAPFTKMSHKNLQITNEMPSDPAFDAVIATYDAKINELFKRKAYYKKVTVDVGYMNAGGIRTDMVWPAGPFSLGDLISWSPFGNMIAVISTDGASFKKFLASQLAPTCNQGTAALNGFYPQISGVKVTYKCSGKGMGAITSLKWDDNKNGKSGDIKDADSVNMSLSTYMKGLFDDALNSTAKYVIDANEATRIDLVLETYTKVKEGVVCPNLEGRSSISFNSSRSHAALKDLAQTPREAGNLLAHTVADANDSDFICHDAAAMTRIKAARHPCPPGGPLELKMNEDKTEETKVFRSTQADAPTHAASLAWHTTKKLGGTWALTPTRLMGLDSLHRRQLRRLLGIFHRHTLADVALYDRCNSIPLSEIVTHQRWRLLEHVLGVKDDAPANICRRPLLSRVQSAPFCRPCQDRVANCLAPRPPVVDAASVAGVSQAA